jgi:hypothetical protein
MGLYLTPKRQRYRIDQTHRPIKHYVPNQTYGYDSIPDAISGPGDARNEHTNSQLLAYLYSLTTTQNSSTIHFGLDTEQICIDTGASACISARRENFITFNKVDNIKINGIGTGLPVVGIGTLKWTLRDDKNSVIDLHVHEALYVPSAPMGLLCPQQIAMQTRHHNDGFQALRHAGILTFAGHTRFRMTLAAGSLLFTLLMMLHVFWQPTRSPRHKLKT